jgi:hypothetical protein
VSHLAMRMGLRPHLGAVSATTAGGKDEGRTAGWGVLPMVAAAVLGDHDRSPTRRTRRTFAMSLDPHHHHDTPPSGPLTDEGSPEGARAANLLVGVMTALLLIALGVIVALA